MRRKRNQSKVYKASLAILVIWALSLSLIGYGYALWSESLRINGTIETGEFTKEVASIRIRKTLEGVFTNPYNGFEQSTPVNLIHVYNKTGQNVYNWPSILKLTIIVENNGTTTLTNILVKDTIGTNIGPIAASPESYNYSATSGTVIWLSYAPPHDPWDFLHFGWSKFNWTIPTLNPGESATIVIWLRTLMNPKDKWEPTDYDKTISVNDGASVVAFATYNGVTLSAQTQGISLIVDGYIRPESSIAEVLNPLPYSTPWACDKYET
ncbi:MAG: hypothetical protein ACUVQ8_05045 [Nitrososphaeria archaeon]